MLEKLGHALSIRQEQLFEGRLFMSGAVCTSCACTSGIKLAMLELLCSLLSALATDFALLEKHL